MIQLQDFINTYTGSNNVGDTDGNRGQCVGLIEVWTDNLGEPHTWGNACDLIANADLNSFDAIGNTPDNFPSAGDIICWQAGWAGSAVGHTAIVVSADVNNVTVFEQNDRIGGGNGECRTYTFNTYEGVQGWLHPKVLDPAPVAPIAPPVTPVVPDVQPTPPAPEVTPVEAVVVAPAPVEPSPVDLPSSTPITIPEVPVQIPNEPINIPVTVKPVVMPDHQTNQAIETIINNEVKHMSNAQKLRLALAILTNLTLIVAALVQALNTGQAITAQVLFNSILVAVEGIIEHKQIGN